MSNVTLNITENIKGKYNFLQTMYNLRRMVKRTKIRKQITILKVSAS